MSRRTAIIEEEFDDDTDLPLPNIPLPNTGSSGPLLEEIGSDDDYDFDPRAASRGAGPASPSSQSQFRSAADSANRNAVTDITPYKTCVGLFPY